MALNADHAYETVAQVVIGTAETVIYTVPASTQIVAGVCKFPNVTAASASLTVHLRRLGAAAADGTKIANGVAIQQGERWTEEGLTMAATDVLSALSSVASAFTATLTGLRRT